MNILVTGGAGFIASHTIVELMKNADNHMIALDNFSNSSAESVKRVERLCGRKVKLYTADVRNEAELEQVFASEKIDAVIHFAGLKAVGESVEKPLLYYENNVIGTVHLLNVMKKYNVKNMVFSSSATVYGNPNTTPITEEFPVSATNPYGRSKLMIEEILKDVYKADKEWNIALLRYFNPIGAHESGTIGEAPNGIPNNLIPYVAKVASGELEYVNVFGDDYDTTDGTGVRDYIHVVDLAVAHVKALDKLSQKPGLVIYNIGTGVGYSVLEVIEHYSNAVGRKLPYRIAPRRQGDIAVCYADTSKAYTELGFKAERGMQEMCEDSWRWQSNNPNGYEAN